MVEWPWEILNNISNFWIFKALSGQNLEFSIFQLCDLAMLNFIKMLLLTTVNARRDIFEWLIKNGNFVSDSIELRRTKDYRGVFSKKFIAKDEIIMKIFPENLIIYNDEWRDWERFNKKIRLYFPKMRKKNFVLHLKKNEKIYAIDSTYSFTSGTLMALHLIAESRRFVLLSRCRHDDCTASGPWNRFCKQLDLSISCMTFRYYPKIYFNAHFWNHN